VDEGIEPVNPLILVVDVSGSGYEVIMGGKGEYRHPVCDIKLHYIVNLVHTAV
jgi:hypothetical protein